MSARALPGLAATGLALFLAACGAPGPCEGVRDLATSPDGLRLAQEEHQAGWGQTDCFQCHQAWALHREACSSFADTGQAVDLAEIAEQVDPRDSSSCVPCHGANGVPAWEQALEEEP